MRKINQKLMVAAIATLSMQFAHADILSPQPPVTYPYYFPFSQESSWPWYFTLGAATYSVNINSHQLPVSFGNWVPSIPQPAVPSSLIPTALGQGFNANNPAVMLNFALGYNLRNNPLLGDYFDDESVVLTYSQFNRATKDLTQYSGATGVDAGAAHGVIWSVDDTSTPIYTGGALRIVNSYMHASLYYKDANLFIKGNVINLPGNMQSTARLGLSATNFQQIYSYTINSTTQGITHDPHLTTGNDKLWSQYEGLYIGDKLALRIAPAFAIFVDGSAELLVVTASLVANEIPDALAAPNGVYSAYANNARASDHDTALSYRATASAGISFYPGLYSPNSPKLTISGGVDQWGYVPKEITVTAPNSASPHIERSSMRNYFAAFDVTIPI